MKPRKETPQILPSRVRLTPSHMVLEAQLEWGRQSCPVSPPGEDRESVEAQHHVHSQPLAGHQSDQGSRHPGAMVKEPGRQPPALPQLGVPSAATPGTVARQSPQNAAGETWPRHPGRIT